MHTIGVISDTHLTGPSKLPESIWRHFADVELIIHAGDISVLSVISELETLAPVVAVQGNVEREEVVLKLPIKREIKIGSCRIGIVHILGDSQKRGQQGRIEFPNADCVVFGHSHIPCNQEYEGQLLFNPGSALQRRKQPACSIGKLFIDNETQTVKGEIIFL